MSSLPPHTSYSTLVDYADNRLSSDEQRRVELHLSQCDHCSEQAEFLATLISRMRNEPTRGVAPEVFARVAAAMESRPAKRHSKTAIRKILAVLQSELPPLVPAFGERSGGTTTRQFLYRADQNAVDLHVTPERESLRVEGVILGPLEAGEVELASSENSRITHFDESGRFGFLNVASGDYRLSLRWGGVEIEVSEIKL